MSYCIAEISFPPISANLMFFHTKQSSMVHFFTSPFFQFLAAVLSFSSRVPTHGEHNVTSLTYGFNVQLANSTVEDNLVQGTIYE